MSYLPGLKSGIVNTGNLANPLPCGYHAGMDDELRDRLDRIEAKLDALLQALAEEMPDDLMPALDLDGNLHQVSSTPRQSLDEL